MSWTEERVELLKTLWAQEASASEIAAEIGGVTRNAVIGKVHRLGLAGRVERQAPRRARSPKPWKPAAAPRKVIRRSSTPRVFLPGIEEPQRETPADDLLIPLEQRVGIPGLTDAICHWPVGDPGEPEFFFCGGPAVAGKPYCLGHCRVAFVARGEHRSAEFTFRPNKAA